MATDGELFLTVRGDFDVDKERFQRVLGLTDAEIFQRVHSDKGENNSDNEEA